MKHHPGLYVGQLRGPGGSSPWRAQGSALPGAWGRSPRLLPLLLLFLLLTSCSDPGVSLVQNGTVPENPTAPVGLAIRSFPGFKEVTWERFVDQAGVTRVLATGEFRMDLPEIASCPATGQGGMVRAGRLFLRMEFTVDLAARRFVFSDSQYMAYSPQGWPMSYPGGVSAFQAILDGRPGLDCGVVYAPGP